MTRIHSLHESAYQNPLEPVEEGRRAFTHLAMIKMDKPRQFYLKVFPDDSRGMANEIAGWLMASALGLTVPERTCLITVPGAALNAMHGGEFPEQSVAFGSEALPGRSVKYWFRDIEAIANTLSRWDERHKATAFDDWTANADRNIGNVIRLEKNRFVLIDHGDILTGQEWMADMLDPAIEIRNTLEELIWKGRPDKEDASRIAESAKGHLAALTHSKSELIFWWSMLLRENELKAAQSFLENRAMQCADRLKMRYGMIL